MKIGKEGLHFFLSRKGGLKARAQIPFWSSLLSGRLVLLDDGSVIPSIHLPGRRYFVITARFRLLPLGLAVFSPHILLHGLRASRYHEDVAFRCPFIR